MYAALLPRTETLLTVRAAAPTCAQDTTRHGHCSHRTRLVSFLRAAQAWINAIERVALRVGKQFRHAGSHDNHPSDLIYQDVRPPRASSRSRSTSRRGVRSRLASLLLPRRPQSRGVRGKGNTRGKRGSKRAARPQKAKSAKTQQIEEKAGPKFGTAREIKTGRRRHVQYV